MDRQPKPNIEVAVSQTMRELFAQTRGCLGTTSAQAESSGAAKSAKSKSFATGNAGWEDRFLRRDGTTPLRFTAVQLLKLCSEIHLGKLIYRQSIEIFVSEARLIFLSLRLHTPLCSTERPMYRACALTEANVETVFLEWVEDVTAVVRRHHDNRIANSEKVTIKQEILKATGLSFLKKA